jgi:hypothetical protein
MFFALLHRTEEMLRRSLLHAHFILPDIPSDVKNRADIIYFLCVRNANDVY